MSPSVLELCAGGGGQALGLEQAGFEHAALAEIDPDACNTLRANRPGWKVIEGDIRDLDGRQFEGVDVVAGGVPCTPFTIGGKQLGEDDDRNLFPEALRIISQARPRIVMLENVAALDTRRFGSFRARVLNGLAAMGYQSTWRLVRSCDFGVPQLRPRLVLISVLEDDFRFRWPRGCPGMATSVGMALYELVGADGWEGAYQWAARATDIAPTIVGGSRKHGGPDLGPTRAREAWKKLGVDGRSIAERAPAPGHEGLIRLTIPMVARLQGFPDDWAFSGRKTAAYRQVGNAFPPPVARAFGTEISRWISPHV